MRVILSGFIHLLLPYFLKVATEDWSSKNRCRLRPFASFSLRVAISAGSKASHSCRSFPAKGCWVSITWAGRDLEPLPLYHEYWIPIFRTRHFPPPANPNLHLRCTSFIGEGPWHPVSRFSESLLLLQCSKQAEPMIKWGLIGLNISEALDSW